jgi:hypothetical protein
MIFEWIFILKNIYSTSIVLFLIKHRYQFNSAKVSKFSNQHVPSNIDVCVCVCVCVCVS